MRLQAQLNSIHGGTSHLQIFSSPTSPYFELPHTAYMPVTLRTLMEGRDTPPEYQSMVIDASATRNLLSRLSDNPSRSFTTRYTEDLLRCVNALERQSSPRQPALDTIRAALSPNNLPQTILFEAGLWPSIGPENLLSQLSFHLREGLPNNWRIILTSLAETLATRQQALRLDTFKRLGLDAEYRQEAENCGGQGWDTSAYPDWLLVQLDANILIRPVQASIAKAMMVPESQTNTVMQLNMGDGKSSVSIPCASTQRVRSNCCLGYRSHHFCHSG
jgi:hypothetical protein